MIKNVYSPLINGDEVNDVKVDINVAANVEVDLSVHVIIFMELMGLDIFG